MPKSAWRLQKTEAGHAAFKQRSTDISARQRSAFLLFDGQRTVGDVLATTGALGVTDTDIDDLIVKGFLQAPTPLPAPAPSSVPALDTSEHTGTSNVERYRSAYLIATRLTSQLGLRGFKLNLAVEAASGYDDLVALLPKLTDALGPTAVQELKHVLGVH